MTNIIEIQHISAEIQAKELFNNLKHFSESRLLHFKTEKGPSTEDSQLPKIQSLSDIEKTGGK